MTPGLMILKLSEGMTTSFFIFSLTLVFSLPLGLGVALIRMSPNHVLRSLTRGYISVMRGTPLMLQLLVVYFSPYYLLRIRLSPDYRFWAVIIAFVLNYAAYFAEIYRGGIESVPRGQREDPGGGHGGLLQHGRTVLQGHARRGGGAVRGIG